MLRTFIYLTFIYFLCFDIYRLIPKWLATIVPSLVKAGKCAEILKLYGVLTSKNQTQLSPFIKCLFMFKIMKNLNHLLKNFLKISKKILT
jgi:hypothetical protein